MKKLSALIMFTLLATAGYYIGNAVAQNKTSADQQAPDGVLVVEETYGVAVPVQAASPTADSAAGSAAGEDTLSDERDRPGTGGRPGEAVDRRVALRSAPRQDLSARDDGARDRPVV